MGEAFRLNAPQVACEHVEGDIILLHFESGFYYNVHGLGAELCQFLLGGGSPQIAVETLVERFGLQRETLAQEIQVFVDHLLQEGLIVRETRECSVLPWNIGSEQYEPPRLEKFDDLADQLLLDKIDDEAQPAQWSTPMP